MSSCDCNKTDNKKWILTVGTLISFCWLPFFLAFYPGVGMKDEIYVMQDPFGMTNQPIMYNLFLAFFYKAGWYLFNEGNRSTWAISNAIKVTRIISEEERQQILREMDYNEAEAFAPYKAAMEKRMKNCTNIQN